jgi:hypothetical protein
MMKNSVNYLTDGTTIERKGEGFGSRNRGVHIGSNGTCEEETGKTISL